MGETDNQSYSTLNQFTLQNFPIYLIFLNKMSDKDETPNVRILGNRLYRWP